MLDDVPLSVDEFAMYGLISDLAPITSADLVRATGLSPTTVSSLVRRCEARGELIRTDNPEDARSSLLQLTPAGFEVLGRAVPRLLDGIERIERGLRGRYRPVREALRELDEVVRNELGVGPRPYELDGPRAQESSLAYTGDPLTPQQVDEARQFLDWIRARDS
jgi:DNA-binding MarR family transcriptional regulator